MHNKNVRCPWVFVLFFFQNPWISHQRWATISWGQTPQLATCASTASTHLTCLREVPASNSPTIWRWGKVWIRDETKKKWPEIYLQQIWPNQGSTRNLARQENQEQERPMLINCYRTCGPFICHRHRTLHIFTYTSAQYIGCFAQINLNTCQLKIYKSFACCHVSWWCRPLHLHPVPHHPARVGGMAWHLKSFWSSLDPCSGYQLQNSISTCSKKVYCNSSTGGLYWILTGWKLPDQKSIGFLSTIQPNRRPPGFGVRLRKFWGGCLRQRTTNCM